MSGAVEAAKDMPNRTYFGWYLGEFYLSFRFTLISLRGFGRDKKASCCTVAAICAGHRHIAPNPAIIRTRNRTTLV